MRKTFSDSKMIVLDNVLSIEECDILIQQIENSKDYQVKSGGRLVTKRDYSDLSQLIQERCATFIPPYTFRHSKLKLSPDPHNTDYLYWLSPTIDSEWSLVKTPPGGSLSMHLDAATIRSVDCVSFYTVLCYLNDSDGVTTFEYGRQVQPKRGRVLIFDQRLLHQGIPASGTKYVARSQILYTRSKTLETELDSEAVAIYNAGDQDRAFQMSGILEEIVLEF